MIQLRSAPLPHDLLYVLDEALDSDDISGFDHLVLTMFGDTEQIQAVLDRPRPEGRWKYGLGANLLALDEMAHSLANGLEEQEQRAFVAASLAREPSRLHRLAECHAGWNYADSTVGGDLKRAARRPRLTHDGQPAGQVRYRLNHQPCINRYVHRVSCDSTSHAEVLAQRMRTRRPWPHHPKEADRLDYYFEEMRERHKASRERAFRNFMLEHEARKDIDKRQLKQRRKMLARSATTAATILGREAVQKLVTGQELQLQGSNLVFGVMVDQSSAVGHGGTIISLRDTSGSHLAGLCLYFEDTPALEQAASIALHLEAGDEADLLSTGNLYNVATAAATHPTIAEKLAQNRRRLAIDVGWNPDDIPEAGRELEVLIQRPEIRRVWRLERAKILKSDYIDRMTPNYLEPLTDRVWVNKADQLRQFASARLT